MFGRIKKLNSDEYEELSKKLTSIKSDLEILKNDVEKMKSNVASLRGLVNRKIFKEEDINNNSSSDVQGFMPMSS